jgi:Ca2+-binding RTX toxin-like protein
LSGGAGSDQFIFDIRAHNYHSANTVTDFTSGIDGVRMDALHMPELGVSGTLAAGDPRFHAASGATTGHDADDRLIYDTSSGTLYFDPDGNGSQEAAAVATFQSGGTIAPLAATDITIDNGSAPPPRPETAQQIVQTPLSGDVKVDALLANFVAWDRMTPSDGVIHYTFSVADGNQSGITGQEAFNASQQAATRQILAEAASITGITFVETADGNLADLHFATADTVSSFSWSVVWGFDNAGHLTTYQPDGYVYLNNDLYRGDSATQGTEPYAVILHEVGHALGLKHPHDPELRLPLGLDDTDHTVMAYASGGLPIVAFQELDVAALQWIYGGDGLGGLGARNTGTPAQFGTSANETLSGTSGHDYIDAGLGNDTLSGGAGNDLLIGRGGGDSMDGGEGDDNYVASAGDVITDSAGVDTIMTDVSWTLAGNIENLRLTGLGDVNGVGNSGANVIAGNGGNNVIVGLEGDDSLYGGAGDNVYDMSFGTGTSYGNDFIDGSRGGVGADVGQDTIDFSNGRSAVVVDLAAGTAAGGGVGGAGTVTMVAVESVIGTAFDDRIVGNADFNLFRGGEGNDTLTGGAQTDRFIFAEAPGGENADLITDFTPPTPQPPPGSPFGGDAPAWDVLTFDGNVFTRIGATSFVDGDARLFAAPGAIAGHDASDRIVYDTSTGNLYYDEDGSGAAGAQLVATLQGAPRLDGSVVDVINGQPDPTAPSGILVNGTAGDDALAGTDGNDTLDGLGGIDTMNGMLGDDTYFVTANDVLHDSGGIDTVMSGVSWTLGTGFENITLTGTANINATGNELGNLAIGSSGANFFNLRTGDDTIQAGGGNDRIDLSRFGTASYGDEVIDGGAGFDLVSFHTGSGALSAVVVDLAAGTAMGGGQGGTGSASLTGVERVIGTDAFGDRLSGSAAAERFEGRGGNDTLSGMGGNDTLVGEAGQDMFVFASAPGSGNVDLVMGFAAGSDEAAFDNTVFTALGADGDFAAGDARFAAGAGFTSGRDASDRIVYNTSTGNLYYDADGSGGGGAQLIATLQGNPTIAANDISVI